MLQFLDRRFYVIMALCAQRTQRMTFGPGIAVAPSRIAPVTAHSIATLNRLFAGRFVVGIGTGNTGRRTMGLPAMRLGAFREYLRALPRLDEERENRSRPRLRE